MDELQRLLDRASEIAATGNRLSKLFADELARVWKTFEREVVTLAAQGAADAQLAAIRAAPLREQVRQALTLSGYDALVGAMTQASAETLMDEAVAALSVAQRKTLQASVGPAIEALRRIAATDLFAQGDSAATAVWRSLVFYVQGEQPVSKILGELSRVIDASQAHVRTLFDTQVSILSRQIEDLATELLGEEQVFLYLGPIDDAIRPFCEEHVGKVYTRKEIDRLDNGQLPNVFLTGGGYNCRHSWIAVEIQALKDLAGTGERVPEVQKHVDRVAARKAEKAAKRKKAA